MKIETPNIEICNFSSRYCVFSCSSFVVFSTKFLPSWNITIQSKIQIYFNDKDVFSTGEGRNLDILKRIFGEF